MRSIDLAHQNEDILEKITLIMSGDGINANQKYKYDEMSNMVLKEHIRSHRDNDIDSNPSSLAGRISARDMGTAVEERRNHEGIASKVENIHGTEHFSDENIVTNNKSDRHAAAEEKSHLFDLVVTEVYNYITDSSHDVIVSATEAILELLRRDDVSNTWKRKEVSSILGDELDDIHFNDLLKLSKRIAVLVSSTDDVNEETEGAPEEGVAIVFDNNEDDANEGEDVDQEVEPLGQGTQNEFDGRQSDDLKEMDNSVVIKTKDQVNKESVSIPVFHIDQFFLQRRISALKKDGEPSYIQNIAERFMDILANPRLTKRELESELLATMENDHFQFIKQCIENRWKIVFKIKLSESFNRESREKVFQEMKGLQLHELASELLHDLDTSNERKRKREGSNDLTYPGKEIKAQKVGSTREPQLVDLDFLSFDQGSHLMTTSKVKLPQGSYQQNKKLYNIITVPPPSVRPFEDSGTKLVSVSDLPDWCRPAFPTSESSTLNPIQSKIFPQAFGTDENILLCAPTGAGKTNVAVLSILRAIDNYRNLDNGKIAMKDFKIVYIAPLKALVQEQTRELERRLTPTFGLVVNELTGDASLSRQQVNETQIIVTTPEKWDIITRKCSSDAWYVDLIKLVIIDEIHLLHDERGPVLECIVNRTLRQGDKLKENIRLIGLSATLPNYKDVAQFLGVDFGKGLFYFDSSYRPCPLEQKFFAIKEKKAIKKLSAMNEACYDKLLECLSSNHQLIIFVHSRKETHKTAKWLHEKLLEEGKSESVVKSSSGTAEILRQEAEDMDNRHARELAPLGFGIHHAGLNKSERSLVEDLFAQGHLKVLVSTATLAWGVNLPAHTVVIKGTETYSPERGTWVQLSPQDIMQMLGRAGRPRYDSSGEGVIITSQDEIQYYLAVLNQQLPIESQLMSKLPDCVNAEIILGSIKNRNDGVVWLGFTYLYIRMLSSPGLYHVGPEEAYDTNLYWKRVDLIHTALSILHENNLIKYDSQSGAIQPTELGRIASHFYINYGTVNMYNKQLKSWMSEIDVLRTFSSSDEFKYIPVRQEEKLEVAKLVERCPIPIKDSPVDSITKVNVLLQSYISRLTLEGFALIADMVYVSQSASRLLRAIHEIVLSKRWSSLSKSTLELCKMVDRRMWLSNSPFRQFGPSVPKEITRASEASHLQWVNYFNLDASELAEAINFRGHSQRAYELLQHFPRLSASCYAQPITPTLLRLQVQVSPEWKWNKVFHGNAEQFLFLVEDCDGDRILYFDNFVVRSTSAEEEHFLDLTVPIFDTPQPYYFVTFISEKWLNSLWRFPVDMTDMKIPRKFHPYTDLLDLEEVAITELALPEFLETFNFSFFNKFQSQSFGALFGSNENILIGMSKGNGKTTCAELALLGHWKNNRGRVVYLHPSLEIIEKQYKLWKRKYSKIANSSKAINKLTGEVAVDVSLLNQSHVCLATPEQFEYISRRWMARKVIQSIELVICEDIHTIGEGFKGALYELLLARLRLISTQVKHPLRIVALSASLANGREVGEWLGCEKQCIFNFSPTLRFNKIDEIRISPINRNSDTRVLPLLKTWYESMRSSLKENKSILFVPTRKDCINSTLKLVELLETGQVSITSHSSLLESSLNKIKDPFLKTSITKGIAIYYEHMASTDKTIVEKLFNNDLVKILIASKDTSCFCPSANHVTILTTQQFDIKEHVFTDYSISEILEMVGCCRSISFSTKVLIFANLTKFGYYSKFLNEALPVESNLNIFLEDAFCHEISTRMFKKRQDCIDWITYTYFYRRILANPSFYEVKDTSHYGISGYLSDLVESNLKELADAEFIELEDPEPENDDIEEREVEQELSPLNGVMVTSFHNVSFFTVREFGRLGNESRLKAILEVVSGAAEFESIPMRESEDTILEKLYDKLPLKLANFNSESPHFKIFVLLQSHFSRIPLPENLMDDQTFVLERVLKVLFACIDYLSGEGFLNAIFAMDLSQMIVQAVWNRESPLKQIPCFDDNILKRCKRSNVETVYDVMALEDDERNEILRLDGEELNKVAEFVNLYPNIDISYELDLSDPIIADKPKEIVISVERDEEMEDLTVVAPRFFPHKQECWWVVVGDPERKQLYAIKKVTIGESLQKFKLLFVIPEPGRQTISIWCMCDSYVDADKEVSLDVDVRENEDD